MGKDKSISDTLQSESTADRELVITRLLNAPRELLWKAWTDPKHLINWFGPKGFTNTFLECDIRPGGVWKFIMHGPDGVDYPNRIVFDKIVKPDYLTYTHGRFDGPEMFRVKVSFEEEAGKTRITMHSIFPTTEALNGALNQAKKYGALEGGNSTLDKLEEELKKMK